MPLTDQQIDEILDQQRPHMRECYRQMFERGQPWCSMKVGHMKTVNGSTWDFMMYWTLEPVADLIAGVLNGYVKLNATLQRGTQPQGTVPPPPPADQKGNAFGL